ncbi:MAG TPA: glycine--tRNA ligase subunit beta [Sphingomicrobium sp.]|nr:glycine--tRNA ligase subunit beta [Sphingomicrobium sp.]
MSDFLLELRCEEIPARMQAGARGDLARLFAEGLAAASLRHDGVQTWSTPRRLVLIAKNLPDSSKAQAEELKGPRTSAPPQALEGFLRKTGLRQDQLEDRDGIWFATIERPGQATADLLAEAVERIVRDFPWPKSMRWGAASASTASLRWVRPLHGIVAMLGEAIVPVIIDGIAAGAMTVGHRFHHPGPITIGGADDYFEKLRACHVIVDQEERERIIRDGAARAAADAGLSLVEDEGLVVENAGLTEWPVPLLGRFDPDYLDVPREVIVLTMRTNQKYFACTGGDGERSEADRLPDGPTRPLAPAFVCVANIAAKDGGAAIVEGNRRVLAARLSDARFFWEQDLKVPLEEQAAKLGGIVFHDKLGTIADKVERVAKLARWLVEEGIVKGADPGLTESAARLAKADLVTGMVGEFPELQGVIGGYLARAQGEPDAVADAVRDHYKPVGQGDEVPTAPVTVAVSLADKLDSLIGFFSRNERPTGSKDPFALRRAALGALSLSQTNALRFGLVEPFDLIRSMIHEQNRGAHLIAAMDFGGRQVDRSAIELAEFLADRLKVQQRDAGVRHDLIDAVFALGGEDDLVRLLARVKALQAFVETGEGRDLLAGYKRAANILKKEKWDDSRHPELDSRSISPSAEPSPEWMLKQVQHDGLEVEEQALISALDAAEPRASAAIDAEDFTAAMAALASLRGPIDAFFDHVTVNDPDPGKRARRLGFLARFRDAVNRVADFSKIEG